MDLDGENERVESEMKPCFIIAETSLDFSEFSAAIEALIVELRMRSGKMDFAYLRTKMQEN